MIRITLEKTENRVKINSRFTEKFEVKEGIRHGDPLSSLLFNIVLEKTIQEANISRAGLVYHKKHQCLAFADDLAILARSKVELINIVKRLEEKARSKGLYIKAWGCPAHYEDSKIRVICLSPGATDTPMMQNLEPVRLIAGHYANTRAGCGSRGAGTNNKVRQKRKRLDR
ncbi:unnamed protein product [Acanthoscelides obtectus]|uniref:Reverse transcriptase domain-containing protein n=1 Tax=Acanthoscelides obtectus TaxID=200917 RepID=A0A9P0K0C3_ACAOB|nr:unnamed protein product [Acanthoscelides obtectus]CAK1660378.1 hypothetical protein AOBTE_LOCUS22033 [Acanthoscelides obtectus]